MTFEARRALALALLNKGEGLSVRAPQFCGQTTASPIELTGRQQGWLVNLAVRAGLTHMLEGSDA